MSEIKYHSFDNKQDIILCVGDMMSSQKLPATGGRFVYYDISDAAWYSCADNATAIGGWVEMDTDKLTAKATSSTKGGTKFPITDVEGKIFELPYAAAGAAATLTLAVAKALIGKKIDLYVDANGVQYADNAANQAVFQVKGYSVKRNTLRVMVIPAYNVQVA